MKNSILHAMSALLMVLILGSCVNKSKVEEKASSLIMAGDFGAAMDELLTLDDEQLLGSKKLMKMLGDAYCNYSVQLNQKMDVVAGCADAKLSPDNKHLAFLDTAAMVVRLFSYPDFVVEKGVNLPGKAWAIAINPASDCIAVAMDDNTVKIYDLKSGMLNKTLVGHSDKVRDLVYKDNEHLYTCSNDNTVAEWLLPEGKMLWSRKMHDRNIKALTLSSDKSMIATASADGSTAVFPTTGKPDDDLIIRLTPARPGVYVNGIAFSPDGKYLYTSDCNRRVIKWYLKDHHSKQSVVFDVPVTELEMINDGQALVAVVGNVMSLLDPETLEPKAELYLPASKLVSLIDMPKGKFGFVTNKKFVCIDFLDGQDLIYAARELSKSKE